MKKYIYPFLLLLLLTRSSECASSENGGYPYSYTYWDGLNEKTEEKSRVVKIVSDFNVSIHSPEALEEVEDLNHLKKRIAKDLRADGLEVNAKDIAIYITSRVRGAEPKLVESVVDIIKKGRCNGLVVLKKTGKMTEIPDFSGPFGVTVTLCNCEKEIKNDKYILDNATIRQAKEKFGISSDMKLSRKKQYLNDDTVLKNVIGKVEVLKELAVPQESKVECLVYPLSFLTVLLFSYAALSKTTVKKHQQ